MLPLTLLFACAPKADPDDTSAALDTDADADTDTDADTDADADSDSDTDADSDTDTDVTPTEPLYGTVPDEAIGVPTFSATNRDGSARGEVDLVGHPTVMWFYPAAGTGG